MTETAPLAGHKKSLKCTTSGRSLSSLSSSAVGAVQRCTSAEKARVPMAAMPTVEANCSDRMYRSILRGSMAAAHAQTILKLRLPRSNKSDCSKMSPTAIVYATAQPPQNTNKRGFHGRAAVFGNDVFRQGFVTVAVRVVVQRADEQSDRRDGRQRRPQQEQAAHHQAGLPEGVRQREDARAQRGAAQVGHGAGQHGQRAVAVVRVCCVVLFIIVTARVPQHGRHGLHNRGVGPLEDQAVHFGNVGDGGVAVVLQGGCSNSGIMTVVRLLRFQQRFQTRITILGSTVGMRTVPQAVHADAAVRDNFHSRRCSRSSSRSRRVCCCCCSCRWFAVTSSSVRYYTWKVARFVSLRNSKQGGSCYSAKTQDTVMYQASRVQTARSSWLQENAQQQ